MNKKFFDLTEKLKTIGSEKLTEFSTTLFDKKEQQSLLTEVYQVIDNEQFSDDDFRLIVDGEGVAGNEARLIIAEPKKKLIYEAYINSCSIVILGLDRFSPIISDIKNQLSIHLGKNIHANCYFAPPWSSGSAPHIDEHDVLVIQLHGKKHWHFGNAIDNLNDVTVFEGKSLFVRKGIMHSTSTSNLASAHVTFGLNAKRVFNLKPIQNSVKIFNPDKIPVLFQLGSIMENRELVKLRVDVDGQECINRINRYLTNSYNKNIPNLFKLLSGNSASEITDIIKKPTNLTPKSIDKLINLLICSNCATVINIR